MGTKLDTQGESLNQVGQTLRAKRLNDGALDNRSGLGGVVGNINDRAARPEYLAAHLTTVTSGLPFSTI
jgi:hypothetical protein